jgi:uncharacterized protein (TIGR00255 family)
MRSMTGFGEAESANERYRVAIVLRGVNHRFLDLALRLRDEQRGSEAALRELFATELERGRVEVGVEIQAVAERPAEVVIQRELVRAVHAACADLVADGLVTPTLTLGDLLRVPEAVRVRAGAHAWEAGDHDLLLAVTRRALAQFVAGRTHEGDKLDGILRERLRTLASLIEQLRLRRTMVAHEFGEALGRRLRELLDGRDLPPERLAQEVALLVDKSDVQEELDRLTSHLEHFLSVMAESGAVGKRLDFLMQEIFRELNTLGAKCRDTAMIRAMLDAKVVAEQLREQVQNVE